ncbi:citrate/2-methylcitrate synthase, partial [Acinetobacter baumannii]
FFGCMYGVFFSFCCSSLGGLNVAFIYLLDDMCSVDNVADVMDKVNRYVVKLLGFGQRVYNIFDPRGIVM